MSLTAVSSAVVLDWSAVTGASFTGVTLMLTTDSTEPPWPSLTTTVKESAPL